MIHLPSRPSRGAATLLVSMLLLFTSSIVVFYLNRGLLFDQKSSANQVRSTSAFEVAEAGIEWATGMLNSPYDITTSCAPLTTVLNSFRKKYLMTGAGSSWAPATTTYPGCKINGTTLTCSCPAVPAAGAEAVATLGTAVQPSFTVAFSAVGDPQAVRVTSTGCVAQAGVCKPPTGLSAATTANSDAWAQVSVILKVKPLLRTIPASALTCGTSCNVGGSYNLRNHEVASNGYLINAGTSVTLGSGTYQTIPGQPVANAMIGNDTSLSAIAASDPTCSASALFKTYFGVTMPQYAALKDTKTIAGCDQANACGSLVQAAMAAGWKNFYFPDGFALSNSAPFTAMGAPGANNGVMIVSPSGIDITGGITIYGMVFSNSADLNDVGTGSANINGAMVTCTGYNSNGNGTLNYDSNALGGPSPTSGTMARVPGSWRDFTP
jgi:Tfp pilus assembly protein PilX